MDSSDASLQTAPPAPPGKKSKAKKEKMGSEDTLNEISQKISQIEQGLAGEKDQEVEIGRFSPALYLEHD